MRDKVSIVMSVYKDRGTLEKTIQSVLLQSYKDFEFIIIDDCSPDNSYSTLNKIAGHDNRLQVFRNEKNLGLTKSLYKGVSHSRGKYIARIDEGDVWLVDKLHKQVAYMESNKSCIILGCQYYNFQKDGKIYKGTKLPDTDEKIKKWLVSGLTPMIHPAILFRNHLINYNTAATSSQDFEIYSRLALKGKMHNLNDVLVGVLRTNETISFKNKHIQFYNHYIIHKNFIESIKNNRYEIYFKNGVDFKNLPVLFSFRKKYMKKIFKYLNKLPLSISRYVKYILIPDYIIYLFYKKYHSIRNFKNFPSY